MDPRIRRAIDFIHEHFKTKIRLAQLSRESGLSTPHFVYLFKKESGVTFKMYVRQLRIKRSQQLMQDPYLSITEVCLDVGYQDLTNFERDFKKLTSVTPRDYRKHLVKLSEASVRHTDGIPAGFAPPGPAQVSE